MKKRSHRFSTVLGVAENQERQAAKSMANSERQLRSHQDQLQELENFRAEYSQRFGEAGDHSIVAARLNDHWRFLQQLDRAIDTQSEAIERTQRILDSQRQIWSSHRVRARAMESLVERSHKEERRAAQRKTQSELDDLSQRRGNRSD